MCAVIVLVLSRIQKGILLYNVHTHIYKLLPHLPIVSASLNHKLYFIATFFFYFQTDINKNCPFEKHLNSRNIH
jgi:hypothetical protein